MERKSPLASTPCPKCRGRTAALPLLDIINPLQHIPVLNTIYRAATGDTIAPPPAFWATPFLAAPWVFWLELLILVAEISGQDVSEHLLAYHFLLTNQPHQTASRLRKPQENMRRLMRWDSCFEQSLFSQNA